MTTTTNSRTQRGRLLDLLTGARGRWVGLPKILGLGIAQYSARICELRRLGFPIQNYREGSHSFFRLAPWSSPAPAPTPTEAQTTLFRDALPVRHRDEN